MSTDLRGPVATGLLLLAILTWQAMAPPGGAAPLAAVGVGAVLFRGVFAPAAVRRVLHPYAEALDLLLSGALVLAAMGLTGGIRSPFALLLFVDLLLIRASLGVAASRFHALVTLLGLGALAGAGGAAAAENGMVGLAARVLWPLPALLAMEVGLPRPAPEPPPLPSREGGRPVRAALPRDTGAPEPPVASVRRAGASADAWGSVVHDLRSPLSVIRVYADLIAEQAARGEPARPDHIRNLANELDLVETLFAAAGPAPPPEIAPPVSAPAGRTDLVRMLGALSESYRVAHGDRVRVEFVAERPEVPVTAEAVSLQRVFRNLLDNAVKFTPPGGRVRVRVGADGSHAVVTVSDTGVGMTAEERAHAFDYAFRGKAARGVEGRGLGLGVSRELIERSGGTITLSSEQGQGSDVIVRLVLAEGGR